MIILVCNAGSTSLKFKLYSMPEEKVSAECRIERVGDRNGGELRYTGCGGRTWRENCVIENYRCGIERFLNYLTAEDSGVIGSVGKIGAIGFKTVLSKGYYGVHRIDEKVLQGMEDMLVVAPAHNRHYLEAIRTFMDLLPDTPMVGSFETAFHQTMPREAYIYSGPYEWYEKFGVRRFGYHGASHSYVADCLTECYGSCYKAVSCHLGGSSSICAIVDGKSVENSFGMSLQAGMLHSNRAGDIDPYIPFYLMDSCGMTPEQIRKDMGSRGGLFGISGVSNDMRDLEKAAEEGNDRAQLAIDIFIHELVRYIGGYAGIMGGIDAIAFTGGIGENSANVRNAVMERLKFFGIQAAPQRFRQGEICRITADESKVGVYVIPANEELGIARNVTQMMEKGEGRK